MQPNRPATPFPQFSKPIRFPIQDNDDFVPIFGQGIKLPKPSPGILIAPISSEHNQNQDPPNVLTGFVPSEKQPDNYVFFNLESPSPVYSGVNRTAPIINHNFNHNFSQSSPTQSSLIGNNNTLNGHSFNNNHYHLPTTVSPLTNNSFNKYPLSYQSTENSFEIGVKPKPNLIASASYSEETQMSPPSDSEESSWNENEEDISDSSNKRPEYNEDKSSSNYDSNNYEESNRSSPYNSNVDHSREDIPTQPYEGNGQEDTKEQSEESQEDFGEVDQSDHESSNYNESSVETQIPHFPSPPKEFFETPDLNSNHNYNPFSNPAFDYDKYIDDLSDHNKFNQNKKLPVQQVKESYKVNEQRLTADGQINKVRKEKNDHHHKTNIHDHRNAHETPHSDYLPTVSNNEQIHNTNSNHNEKLPKIHPGLIRDIQYKPLPEAAPRTKQDRFNVKPQRNRNNYQKHSTSNQHRHVIQTGNSKRNKVKNRQYGTSKNIQQINTGDDSRESTIPPNHSTGSYYTKPNKNRLKTTQDFETKPNSGLNNHKFDESSIDSSTPFSLNFADTHNRFEENEKKNINTDSEYYSPNGQPSIYSVHKQNTLSGLPHQERGKSKEKDVYDDEDYYGSNEDAEYYDDYSSENFHSLVNKQVKPPKVPKQIINIDNMSFDKPNNDEEYDDVSVEETDEEEKTGNGQSNNQTHISDCNKKYKNHKCNNGNNQENEYKGGEQTKSKDHYSDGNNEEDYDEDEEETDNSNNRSKPYEVVEDTAESQHHMRKSALNNKQSVNLFANNNLKKNATEKLNKPKIITHVPGKLGSFILNGSTNPGNKIDNLNKTAQTTFIFPNKRLNNTISKNILLKALSEDQRLSNRSKNVHSNNNLNSFHRFITFPKIVNKPNKTVDNNMSYINSEQANKLNKSSPNNVDNTKLHFSSTPPLNPRPLKHLKQRPVTKPTDLTAAGDFETILNMDSHLTNSVTSTG